ncbi:hypothetical protein [Anaerotignum sp.]|uniref:hypothetical protein n=1 Tax=Anaerotignum sp. TaxID=2039241 RepID=UPI003735EB69
MKRNNNQYCSFCASISEHIRESDSNCYHKYSLILQELIHLERQGMVELLAGDCPLIETDEVLGAERHYTVCHYAKCRRCGTIYFIGACIRGTPVYYKVENLQAENLDTKLWGRFGTYFSKS